MHWASAACVYCTFFLSFMMTIMPQANNCSSPQRPFMTIPRTTLDHEVDVLLESHTFICCHHRRLLVEAGAPLREYDWLAPPHLPRPWLEDAPIMAWLRRESKTPPPLKRQCRTAIYAILRTIHGTDVRPLIQHLTLGGNVLLPMLLQSYILLEGPLSCAAANPPPHLHTGQLEVVPAPAPIPL